MRGKSLAEIPQPVSMTSIIISFLRFWERVICRLSSAFIALMAFWIRLIRAILKSLAFPRRRASGRLIAEFYADAVTFGFIIKQADGFGNVFGAVKVRLFVSITTAEVEQTFRNVNAFANLAVYQFQVFGFLGAAFGIFLFNMASVIIRIEPR